jgi:hypothetical protein
MTKSTTLRVLLAILMIVLGNLQAWDSGVSEAGLPILLLVSLAIALPPVALLAPLSQQYMIGAFALSLFLLVVARLVSPIPLPGLFLILIPAAMGLIFAGLIKQNVDNE